MFTPKLALRIAFVEKFLLRFVEPMVRLIKMNVKLSAKKLKSHTLNHANKLFQPAVVKEFLLQFAEPTVKLFTMNVKLNAKKLISQLLDHAILIHVSA